MMTTIDARARFLEPETRDGHYVSAETKKIWKCELDILEEVLRICQKYSLKVVMHGGTLLGAVRHKGFIPWDDDIDVLMPRKDYDAFLSIAQSELPSPLFLKTQGTDKGSLVPFAVVMNLDTSSMGPETSGNLVVTRMGIGIDIFPFDPMPDDEVRLRRFFLKARIYQSIRRRCVVRRFSSKTDCLKRILAVALMTILGGSTSLYKRQERMVRTLCKSSDLVTRGCECPLGLHAYNYKRWCYDIGIFDEIVDVAFEYLNVPISSKYSEMLKTSYGNWSVFVKGGSLHEGCTSSVEKPFIEALVEKCGYKMSDFPKTWLRN